jgi:hypothetical protein
MAGAARGTVALAVLGGHRWHRAAVPRRLIVTLKAQQEWND